MIGPAVSITDVSRAFQASLEKWLPSVLGELVRRAGAPFTTTPDDPLNPQTGVSLPRSWQRLPDEQILKMTADQSPAIAIVPGGMQDIRRDGEGMLHASILLGAFVQMRGDTYEQTRDLLGIYLTAVLVATIQHGIELTNLDDTVTRVRLQPKGQSLREIDTDSFRSVGYGLVSFIAPVKNIADSNAGPIEPPETPIYTDPDDPIATETDIEVVRLHP